MRRPVTGRPNEPIISSDERLIQSELPGFYRDPEKPRLYIGATVLGTYANGAPILPGSAPSENPAQPRLFDGQCLKH